MVTGSGQREVFQVSLKGKSFSDGITALCEVTDPSPARARMLIEIDAKEEASIRQGRAGEQEYKGIPSESWKEAILDSDLCLEDLAENHFVWSKQTLLQETKYGARECHGDKSEPGPSDRSHCASVTPWPDREIYYPVRIEKVVTGSAHVNEFIR